MYVRVRYAISDRDYREGHPPDCPGHSCLLAPSLRLDNAADLKLAAGRCALDWLLKSSRDRKWDSGDTVDLWDEDGKWLGVWVIDALVLSYEAHPVDGLPDAPSAEV